MSDYQNGSHSNKLLCYKYTSGVNYSCISFIYNNIYDSCLKTMTSIENKLQKEISDYNTYLKLKTLKHSNDCILKHLDYTKEHLGYLISTYTFKSNLEYQLESKKGDYKFNGQFYISTSIKHILTTEELNEIYSFIEGLVLQHNGIHHTHTFYSIEQDCELLLIDCKDYCVVILSNELHSLRNNTLKLV